MAGALALALGAGGAAAPAAAGLAAGLASPSFLAAGLMAGLAAGAASSATAREWRQGREAGEEGEQTRSIWSGLLCKSIEQHPLATTSHPPHQHSTPAAPTRLLSGGLCSLSRLGSGRGGSRLLQTGLLWHCAALRSGRGGEGATGSAGVQCRGVPACRRSVACTQHPAATALQHPRPQTHLGRLLCHGLQVIRKVG